MRAQAIHPAQSDPAARFALAWTTLVSFLLFITRDPPDPGLLLPFAIAALPFAAAPRHRIAFRVLAAALLIGFLVVREAGFGGLVFAPAVAALLLSAYQLARGRAGQGKGRKRRARAG